MRRVYTVLSVFWICLISLPSYAIRKVSGLSPLVDLLALVDSLVWSRNWTVGCFDLSYTMPSYLHLLCKP